MSESEENVMSSDVGDIPTAGEGYAVYHEASREFLIVYSDTLRAAGHDRKVSIRQLELRQVSDGAIIAENKVRSGTYHIFERVEERGT